MSVNFEHFSLMLKEDFITEALQQRIESLEEFAATYRQELEAAKVTGAALGAIGLMLSANPLIAVLAGCGLVGYSFVLYSDIQATGRFCPLPIHRKSLTDLFTAIGLSSSGDSETQDPLLNVIGYLEPSLAHEYELLIVSGVPLSTYLGCVPSDYRYYAYQQILRFTKLRNTLKLPSFNEEIIALLPPTQNTASMEVPPTQEQMPTVPPTPEPVPMVPPTPEPAPVVVPSVQVSVVPPTPEPVPVVPPAPEPVPVVPPTPEPVPVVPPAPEPVPVVPPTPEPVPVVPPAPEPVPVVPPAPEPVPVVPANTELKFDWMKNLIAYPALIFGGMGAGKSWTTRQIIQMKIKAGWDIVVLDPHGSEVEWQGIKLITDYEEIASFLQWYIQDTSRTRYDDFRASKLTEDEWRQRLIDQGLNYCVVCEEMSNWGDRVDVAGEQPGLTREFVKTAITDSRKQLAIPLFVAHGRELDFLGDAKNLSKLRDAALLEVELTPRVHPVTKEAVASGQGKLKLPGHRLWMDISLPVLNKKITSFTQSADSSTAEENRCTTYTTAGLPRQQVMQLINQMQASKLSQTQIIKALWGVEKDKTGWKKAYAEYKYLADSSGQD